MIYRQATDLDLKDIISLLDNNKLPSNDCNEHIKNFIVIENNNEIIGAGGLEVYDDIGLVRSIVVDQQYRSNGIAKKLYKLIEAQAYQFNIKSLYLLTETAIEYFNKLGFEIKQRSEIPITIIQTKQLKELCPASATVMYREISNVNI